MSNMLGREQVKQFMDEIVYGYECPLCHLTDHGKKRMEGNGFIVKPCRECEEHFGGTECRTKQDKRPLTGRKILRAN